MTGVSMEEALHEVDLSIDRMFYWATYKRRHRARNSMERLEPVETISIWKYDYCGTLITVPLVCTGHVPDI
ncbi:hypothetical protein Pelo_4838 [Pelomyxa schiedti]|nr:hypothetical protein Pelo_4838 [Pelomyxa schiedti]